MCRNVSPSLIASQRGTRRGRRARHAMHASSAPSTRMSRWSICRAVGGWFRSLRNGNLTRPDRRFHAFFAGIILLDFMDVHCCVAASLRVVCGPHLTCPLILWLPPVPMSVFLAAAAWVVGLVAWGVPFLSVYLGALACARWVRWLGFIFVFCVHGVELCV
jgi:hypothetical protein